MIILAGSQAALRPASHLYKLLHAIQGWFHGLGITDYLALGGKEEPKLIMDPRSLGIYRRKKNRVAREDISMKGSKSSPAPFQYHNSRMAVKEDGMSEKESRFCNDLRETVIQGRQRG